jgi:hypothetical protein
LLADPLELANELEPQVKVQKIYFVSFNLVSVISYQQKQKLSFFL